MVWHFISGTLRLAALLIFLFFFSFWLIGDAFIARKTPSRILCALLVVLVVGFAGFQS